jgi:hypothetical protein
MAKRDEVDEVVGMEVADQDRVQRARLDRADQAREGALAEVEQDRGRPAANEVGGARGAGSIGPGGAGAEDVELEAGRLRGTGYWSCPRGV